MVDEIMDYIGLKDDIKKIFSDVIADKNMVDYFKEIIEFLSRFEGQEMVWECIFDDETIKSLVVESRTISGYELTDWLKSKLHDVLNTYRINEEERGYFVSRFIDMFIVKIKQNNDELYSKIFFNDCFDRVECKLENLKTMTYDLEEAVIKNGMFTLRQIEDHLMDITEPSLTLSFFDFEDENFKINLDHKYIYIKGHSREETTYAILFYLSRCSSDIEKRVRVVKDNNTWNRLQGNIREYILIPFFDATILEPISGNINIFVYGDDENSNKNLSVLRPRLFRNLKNKLVEVGYSINKANKMARDTHMEFAALKRRLFNGKDEPIWADKSKLLPVVFCCKWSKSDDDYKVLEELSDMSWDDYYKNVLINYMGNNDPIIKECTGRVRYEYYSLVSVSDAWIYNMNVINEVNIRKFLSICAEKFDKCSVILSQGMLIGMTMLNNQFSNKYSKEIDDIIINYFSGLKTVGDWEYMSSHYSEYIAEASPKIFVQLLLESMNGECGVASLFLNKKQYTHILWALEKILYDEYLCIDVLNLLFQLAELNVDYDMVNSPKDVLHNIFCAWVQQGVFDVKSKMEYATIMFNKYDSAWSVFSRELYIEELGGLVIPLTKPRYRFYNCYDESLNYEDMWTIYEHYFELCLSHIGSNAQRFKTILSKDSLFIFDKTSEVRALFDDCLKIWNDDEKYVIKESLRKSIYRHRKYTISDWAAGEEEVLFWEGLYNSVEYENDIYNYLYLFDYSLMDFPELHPTPYNRDEPEDYYAHAAKIEQFIQDQLKLFKSRGLSLRTLVEMASQKEYNYMGRCIYFVYSYEGFDYDLYKELASTSNEMVVLDYLRTAAYEEKDRFEENLKLLYQPRYNEDHVLEFLECKEPSVVFLEGIISQMTDDIQRRYYAGRQCVYLKTNNSKLIHYILDKQLHYKCVDAVIKLMEYNKKLLSEDEIIYNLLFVSKRIGLINASNSYDLEQLMKYIYPYVFEHEEYMDDVIEIELLNHKLLGEQCGCLIRQMKKDPYYYSQMINVVLKHDNDDNFNEEKQQIAEAFFSLYYDIQFCPCVDDDNNINQTELKQWVEKYRVLLQEQNQNRAFAVTLGKLFARSPIGKDGYYPHEAVRDVMEEIDSDGIFEEYRVSIYNKRGMCFVNAGIEEKKLSDKYFDTANYFRIRWPKLSKAYYNLGKEYEYESERDRKYAESFG